MKTARYMYFVVMLFSWFAVELALATTSDIEVVTCPVCGNKVKATVVLSTNNFGGMDSFSLLEICLASVARTMERFFCVELSRG